MPMIEFVGPDGDRVEQFHHVPVAEIVVNGAVYKKAVIPSGLRFNTGAQELTQEQEIKRDCYKYEQSQQPWHCDFSKQQIRKIWDI